MSRLDPHDTLVIVASKSFTTTEPLANAEVAMNWLRDAGVADPIKQIVAITANVEAALNLGISPDHIFQIWDWVGGRYSLWSAIGLPVALALGNDTFDQLPAGAAAMDEHFRNAPAAENAPLQLALAGVVNRNVLGYDSLVISPYDSRLHHLVPRAAAGNGIAGQGRHGRRQSRRHADRACCLGHAGHGLPAYILPMAAPGRRRRAGGFHPVRAARSRLCAQSRTADRQLPGAAFGAAARQDLRGSAGRDLGQESDPDRARILAMHLVHPGGRPSSLIVLPRLEAYTLGALLALYEHKVFSQGVIWGINPFDQWGVEFGKALARGIIRELDAPSPQAEQQDPSTRYWIDAIARHS